MSRIDIDHQMVRAERNLRSISEKAAVRAKVQAINKVAARIRSQAASETAKVVRVKKKNISKRIKVKKASTKIPKGKRVAQTYAMITVRRNPIPAISIGTARTQVRRKQGRFLVGSVSRSGNGRFQKRDIAGNTAIRVGRHKFENAFMQKLKNGRWHILHRTMENRYPIDVCSVPIKRDVTRITREKTEALMRSDMAKELKYAMANQVRLLIKREATRANQ